MADTFNIDDHRVQWHFAAATASEIPGLADKPAGFVAGWATASTLNCYDQIVAPGAFDASIRQRGLMGPRGIKLLASHRGDRVCGVIERLEQRGDRLWIEAQIDLTITYANDLYKACKISGGLNFSIGFRIEKYSYDELTEILTITQGDLSEVSIVAFPGNEDATMEIVHSAKENDDKIAETPAQFEARLVRLGLAPSRRIAHRLVQEIKRHARLFQTTADAPVANAVPATPPLLADTVVKDLAASLADIRASLVRS